MKIKICTRTSALALWQANTIKQQLESLHAGLEIVLVGIKTQGDILLDSALSKIGGKGLFVNELENTLLSGEADIAVHSLKDVPYSLPKELMLAVYSEREDPRDVFLSNQASSWKDLKQGASVGTSSLRRQVQLAALRPDLRFKLLRGNVPTRIAKLEAHEYDAIILAAAGVKRLGLSHKITECIALENMLPAVGQGVMTIECRIADSTIRDLLAPLMNKETEFCVLAERKMNQHLGGGCQVPIAGFARLVSQDQLHLRGLVGNPVTNILLTAEATGPIESAVELGLFVAEKLLQQGAQKIIADCY